MPGPCARRRPRSMSGLRLPHAQTPCCARSSARPLLLALLCHLCLFPTPTHGSWAAAPIVGLVPATTSKPHNSPSNAPPPNVGPRCPRLAARSARARVAAAALADPALRNSPPRPSLRREPARAAGRLPAPPELRLMQEGARVAGAPRIQRCCVRIGGMCAHLVRLPVVSVSAPRGYLWLPAVAICGYPRWPCLASAVHVFGIVAL
jgi:hypothetical protein